MADLFKPRRNAEHLSWRDRLMSGFKPPEERTQYLQERADANKAAKDAEAEEEERKRREGARARKDAGY